MLDTPADLAAPFQDPPSPLDMVPAIRWAFVDDGRIDVLHYVESGGRFECHHTVVAAERHGRRWEIDTIDGPDLDFGSADLLAGELSAEAAGRPCAYRIDELDMALERCRLSLERKLAQEAA